MERFLVDGPAGPLEAILDLPEGPLVAAALLCHPLPIGGGTMNTHAVFRATRALRTLGLAVLRFNFRGVGRSAGRWDEGAGELEDARAAHQHLLARYPSLPVLAGGFSFGAWVGMRVGIEEGARWLLGLGAPLSRYDFTPVAQSPTPKAFVLAAHDEYASVAGFETALAEMVGSRRLWIVPGTSHLFTEALDAYEQSVLAAVEWLLSESGG